MFWLRFERSLAASPVVGKRDLLFYIGLKDVVGPPAIYSNTQCFLSWVDRRLTGMQMNMFMGP